MCPTLSWVKVYLDDLLFGAQDTGELWEKTRIVLSRLQSAGVRLQLSKCWWAVSSLPYLGHVISAEGVAPCPTKVQAVLDAPKPTDVTELRAFLGIVNNYGDNLPRLSEAAFHLNAFLRKDQPWRWTKREEVDWKTLKQMLASADVLCHYDPSQQLVLACDA